MKRTTLKDKVIIITGSSRGIGRTLALELARLGAKIVINGRNQIRLLETYLSIKNRGYEVHAVQGDVCSEEDCQRLMHETNTHFGRIDVLVNNASLTMDESFERLDPALFNRIFLSNSIGASTPTICALPFLQQSKGSVLFISSLAGLFGLPRASAYSAGKMSLTGLWQSLKAEFGKTGVHFGICYLSFTENDREKRMLSEGGNLVNVPKRPKFIQQSQLKVAKSIRQMIVKRKSSQILSPLGKLSAGLFRFFPRLTLGLITISQKRKS